VKGRIATTATDSDAFIGEVRAVEEQIHEFLSQRRSEAEAVVAAARREGEKILAQGQAATLGEAERTRDEILLRAREEAALAAQRGREEIDLVDREAQERRERARALLLDHLLGRTR
jgi:hypothetical protein